VIPCSWNWYRCRALLQHHDHRSGAGDPQGQPTPAAPRHHGFQQLEPLVAPIVTALAVIPTELVVQPLPGRAFAADGYGLDRPCGSWSVRPRGVPLPFPGYLARTEKTCHLSGHWRPPLSS
jgi:hypothetical protein